ncbi:ACT domain-containing protein [Wenyingzhuangia sp. 2_MG-2023]|uniref:ACT domain-containing protein n=1 Tax=Wenyingzhuangia sp. 2_MG-2023 TaxID=3062639 RepID=UPI0026E26FAF|nr:ACT domain-containing protein [Wenyingzhuangia sp. 2_MG-2023]MDO6738904.1 ACT domain-containing protein [Wenyingzhuangia sp. 2_MG-2023]
MSGTTNLDELIKGMTPNLKKGEYVFTTVTKFHTIDRKLIFCEFKEEEGTTLVLEKKTADNLHLKYDYVASWITLMIHSSLDAVGLTAIFSTELAKYNISCNVIAAYYHDHIFVNKNDAIKAIDVLNLLAKNHK